ncbi:MAG: PTS system mannose/fructose/sorbose family transporter subunit IID [Longimicrobiales bacterium]
MSRVSRATIVNTFMRSFVIQGSWNYRTLIGCGFAFALLPVLRTLYAHRPDQYRAALQRHTAVFNSHPYLAPMALGAVAVLEETESATVIERFKSAVRGSLGSLGDRLIWAGFRPVCILLALGAVLLGASWAVATGGFLLLYNIGHVAIRIWALRFGLRNGLHVGEKLRAAPVERIQHWMQLTAAFLLGFGLALLVSGRPVTGELPVPWTVAALLAAGLASLLGARVRLPMVLALIAFALISIVRGAFS